MALADATATGFDDLLDSDTLAFENGKKDWSRGELTFRDQQLKRLRDEILDIEDTANDGVSMNDLTLDDFIADLLRYIQQNRAELEAAPFGIYAIADVDAAGAGELFRNALPSGQRPHPIRPGAIFCLKQRTAPAERTPNLLQPYFLVYVRDDGTVRYTFRQAGQILALFQSLAAGRSECPDGPGERIRSGNGTRHNGCRSTTGLSTPPCGTSPSKFRAAELRQLTQSRSAPGSPQSGNGPLPKISN